MQKVETSKQKLDRLDKWTAKTESEYASGKARGELNYPNIKKERKKLVEGWAKESKAIVDAKKARKGTAGKVGGVPRPKGMY